MSEYWVVVFFDIDDDISGITGTFDNKDDAISYARRNFLRMGHTAYEVQELESVKLGTGQ